MKIGKCSVCGYECSLGIDDRCPTCINNRKRKPFFRFCKRCDEKFSPITRHRSLCPNCFKKIRGQTGIGKEKEMEIKC